MRFLLDTNHASHLVGPNQPLRATFIQRIASGDTFFVTPNHLTEILFGISVLPRASENLRLWALIQRELGVFEFTVDDAARAANLMVAMRKTGRQLSVLDAQIAVVALREDATLLTTDRDFEQLPGLRSANWLRPLAE
jgi:predicted nucleic acid-binding protein